MSRLFRFNFHHFDQESDVGVEADNGELVRKRKRPGRKPNPPSLQERRAQNRAAQKAFREREHLRQKLREAEREAHVKELENLRQQLKQARYEADYLRGCVLLLTLVNLTERGSAPVIYSESRMFPVPILPYQLGPGDSLEDTPSILRNILEPDTKRILDFKLAVSKAKENGCAIQPDNDTIIPRRVLPLNQDSQDVRVQFPKSRSQKPKEPNPPAPTLPTSSSKPRRRKESTANLAQSSNPDIALGNPSESLLRESTATQAVCDITTEVPTLKTPDDLAHMPSSQALHILRLQLRCASILGNTTRLAFAPTALQRLIPHDLRIDYVPEPAMRDRMILFQGLYDADEMFHQLSSQVLFIGGDVRNEHNWLAPPSFSEKYWYLSHQLYDLRITKCAIRDLTCLMTLSGSEDVQDTTSEPSPSTSNSTSSRGMNSNDDSTDILSESSFGAP